VVYIEVIQWVEQSGHILWLTRWVGAYKLGLQKFTID